MGLENKKQKLLISIIVLLFLGCLLFFLYFTFWHNEEDTEEVEDDLITQEVGVDYEFSSGDGTEHNPYEIQDSTDLDHVRYYSGSYFLQTEDIDLRHRDFTPIGIEEEDFEVFYDGDGHIIKNLNVNKSDDNVGLFSSGEITSLGVEGVVQGENNVGGIVGSEGVVEESYFAGHVQGEDNVGGLIGKDGEVLNSYSTGNNTVKGNDNVGGLVGYDGYIDGSYSNAKIEGENNVGGLLGSKGQVGNSFSLMEEIFSEEDNVGRIFGSNAEIFEDNYGNVEIDLEGEGDNMGIDFNLETDSGIFEEVLDNDVWDFSQDVPKLKIFLEEGEVKGLEDGVVWGEMYSREDTGTTIVTEEGEEHDITLSSTSGGSTTPEEGTHTYTAGTSLTVSASPDSGYSFQGWTEEGVSITSQKHYSFTVEDDRELKANFEKKEHSLSISRSSGGSVVPQTGSYSHEYGDVVNLEAQPDSGYEFSSWSGDVESVADTESKETSVVIYGDYAIKANFEKEVAKPMEAEEYTLNITSEIGGSVSEPGEGDYEYEEDENVTLEATPDEGYVFSHWSGDVGHIEDENSKDTELTMPDEDIAITANFGIGIQGSAKFLDTEEDDRLCFNDNDEYDTCDGTNSEVYIDIVNGDVNGYGWSDILGWVYFDSVSIDQSSGEISGTAEVLDTGNDIYFDDYESEVIMDLSNGEIYGYAWSEDVGWIEFEDEEGKIESEMLGERSLSYEATEGGEILSGETYQTTDFWDGGYWGEGEEVCAGPEHTEHFHFIGWDDGVETLCRQDNFAAEDQHFVAEFEVNFGVGVVDNEGEPIDNPHFDFPEADYSFDDSTTMGMDLGDDNQRFRIRNNQKYEGFDVTLAPSVEYDTWKGSEYNLSYDDAEEGLLSVNPEEGVLENITGEGCADNLDKGVPANFAEGNDSITLISGGLGQEIDNCQWDFSHIGLEQSIPAQTPIDNYELDMVVTIMGDGDKLHEVKFQDEHGDPIKTEMVEYGGEATPPSTDPETEEEGKYFVGWDTNYENVTSDLTIQPEFVGPAVTITGYDSSNPLEELNIPETIIGGQEGNFEIDPELGEGEEGYVYEIGSSAFEEYEIVNVNISDSVRRMGSSAFRNGNIQNLTLGKRVEEIGWRAFQSNNLEEVTIPDRVEEIGPWAFENNSLQEVIIPDRVEEIGASAFENNSLQEVIIPDRVEEIRSSAFENNSLQEVIISDRVEEIGSSAFAYNDLEEVIIPDRVEEIGSSAFRDNSLQEVTIPDRVEEIGSLAFAYNDLEEVTIGDRVEVIGVGAFRNNSLQEVTIPDRVKVIGVSAFRNNSLQEVTIPDRVEVIGASAFRNNSLQEVTIPDRVEVIGNFTFGENNFNNFAADVTFEAPEKITYLSGFSDNDLIGEVDLTPFVNLGEIGGYAFRGNNIEEVMIPNNVWRIGDNAFAYNNFSEFDDITFEAPENIIYLSGFRGNDFVAEYDFLTQFENLEVIGGSSGAGAFASNNLEEVVIPSSVEKIGDNAFAHNNFSEFDDITFEAPENIIYLSGFRGNDFVEEYDFLTQFENLEVIGGSSGAGAFQHNNLEKVTIPDGVKEIRYSAFESNNLTEVTISDSVEEIGGYGFSSNNLGKITIGDNVSFNFFWPSFYYNPGDFGEDYINNDRIGGTYEYDSESDEWIMQ